MLLSISSSWHWLICTWWEALHLRQPIYYTVYNNEIRFSKVDFFRINFFPTYPPKTTPHFSIDFFRIAAVLFSWKSEKSRRTFLGVHFSVWLLKISNDTSRLTIIGNQGKRRWVALCVYKKDQREYIAVAILKNGWYLQIIVVSLSLR